MCNKNIDKKKAYTILLCFHNSEYIYYKFMHIKSKEYIYKKKLNY